MRSFVDRLQNIHYYLPLRTVPLQVAEFTPVTGRLDATKRAALEYQYDAIHAWQEELDRRYTSGERSTNIALLPR